MGNRKRYTARGIACQSVTSPRGRGSLPHPVLAGEGVPHAVLAGAIPIQSWPEGTACSPDWSWCPIQSLEGTWDKWNYYGGDGVSSLKRDMGPVEVL